MKIIFNSIIGCCLLSIGVLILSVYKTDKQATDIEIHEITILTSQCPFSNMSDIKYLTHKIEWILGERYSYDDIYSLTSNPDYMASKICDQLKSIKLELPNLNPGYNPDSEAIKKKYYGDISFEIAKDIDRNKQDIKMAEYRKLHPKKIKPLIPPKKMVNTRHVRKHPPKAIVSF